MKQSILSLLILCCFFYVTSLAQQAGTLDPSFGIDGVLIRNLSPGHPNIAFSLALDEDGNIFAGGYLWRTATENDMAIASFLPNGESNLAFGINGVATLDLGSDEDVILRLIRLPNGQMLAGGIVDFSSNNDDFALARFNSNGTIDSTFGINGSVITEFSNEDDYAYGLLVTADGGILQSGYSDVFCTVKYSSEGVIDTLFGNHGKVTTQVGTNGSQCRASALQADGKFLLVGNCHSGTDKDFAMVRYTENGDLDSTFGDNGIVIKDHLGQANYSHDVAIQPDGKIVVVGGTETPITLLSMDLTLLRYNVDGTLDSTFGNGGIMNRAIGMMAGNRQSIQLQQDGKILVSTIVDTATYSRDLTVLRFLANGEIDSSFAQNGSVRVIIPDSYDVCHDMIIQPDLKILTAGFSAHNIANFYLARFFSGLQLGVIDQAASNELEVLLYPNPMEDYVTLDFSMNSNANLSAELYTLGGQFVKSFFKDSKQLSGNHKEVFFVGDVAPGLYLLTIGNEQFKKTVRLIKH